MISADATLGRPRAVSPGGRTIVRLRALDIDAAPALRERLNEVLHRGAELVVLDLSHVLSCDMSGLAIVIGAQRRARLLGLTMLLAAPTRVVAELLRSTGLDRRFTICQDLSSALASERFEPAMPGLARGSVRVCVAQPAAVAPQDQVTHDKYGLGRVMKVEDDTSVDMDFGTQQIRIKTPCAKLTKL